MRRVLLAATLVAASVTFPSPANAGDCTAHAHPPRPNGGQVYAEGVLACGVPATGAFVTVCLDVFWMDNPPGWGPYECSDVVVNDFAQVVAHGFWSCPQAAGPLVRTTVTATTDDGRTASASSLPVPAPTGSCGP